MEQGFAQYESVKTPTWGFASSPLVVGQAVVVHAGGEGDKGVLAFHKDSGELLWSAACGKEQLQFTAAMQNWRRGLNRDADQFWDGRSSSRLAAKCSSITRGP